MINVKFVPCSFKNEAEEVINYVEARLIYGNEEIIVRPINDENKRKLNNALKKEGFKIGKENKKGD